MTEEHTILLEPRDLAELEARGIDTRAKRAMWITATLDTAIRPS